MLRIFLVAFLAFVGTTSAIAGNHESCSQGAENKAAPKSQSTAPITAKEVSTKACSCGTECACASGEKACDCGCAGSCDKT